MLTVAHERGSLTGALVQRIQEMIHEGQLAIGEKLPPERQLADDLGVSRPSVRQAIKSLESMGIVVARVGVGNFVNPDLSPENLLHGPMQFAIRLSNISRRQLYEMRQIVEVQVVGLAAERATDEQIAAVGEALDDMRNQSGEARAMAGCDHRFHMAILTSSGNDIFRMIFEPISKLLWEDLADRMQLFDPARIVDLHRDIYDALRRRDREGAMLAMRTHLDIGYDTFFGKAEAGKASAKRSRKRKSGVAR
jgi:GntR family transcriptional regulator, transcriptional repressor for pyruvate dehydrogenase complex